MMENSLFCKIFVASAKRWAKNIILNIDSEPENWLSIEKIVCWNCSTEIVQYYNKEYKGKRGRCPICGVDFPLD